MRRISKSVEVIAALQVAADQGSVQQQVSSCRDLSRTQGVSRQMQVMCSMAGDAAACQGCIGLETYQVVITGCSELILQAHGVVAA